MILDPVPDAVVVDEEAQPSTTRRDRNRQLADVLRSFREVSDEEAVEQHQTMQVLRQRIDDDRLSDRARFA